MAATNGWKLKEFAVGEIADETAVSGKKIVIGQIFELYPFELVEDFVFQFALEGGDGEELEIDGSAVAVVVADVGYARTDGGADAEFFVEFAKEGLFGSLARLDFSAGEFPLQSHGLIGTALADEHKTFAKKQSGNDKTQGGSGGARLGNGLRLFHTSSVNGS